MSQRHVSIDETVVQALSFIPPTDITAAELHEYTDVPLVVTLIHFGGQMKRISLEKSGNGPFSFRFGNICWSHSFDQEIN